MGDLSTFFFLKNKEGNTTRAFATWFANNAGEVEELFGEGKEGVKERSEVLPCLTEAVHHLVFCTGCIMEAVMTVQV